MQALKTLVIALGVLIIVSIGLLGWGFYTKFQQARVSAPGSPASEKSTPSPTAVTGFDEVRVPLPPGCTVVEMRPDGDRLYLRTGPTGLCERIVVIEADTGRVLGTLVLAP